MADELMFGNGKVGPDRGVSGGLGTRSGPYSSSGEMRAALNLQPSLLREDEISLMNEFVIGDPSYRFSMS
jgi:hypothetical protein